MKQIIITIAADGATSIETKGFDGRKCKLATEDLEKALGVKTKDVPTAELFAVNQTVNQGSK